jgi:hypothetical protein
MASDASAGQARRHAAKCVASAPEPHFLPDAKRTPRKPTRAAQQGGATKTGMFLPSDREKPKIYQQGKELVISRPPTRPPGTVAARCEERSRQETA